ncbi:hypothetical protein [Georgenia daeguensis]|uniref:Uncharacterized protein n=1 Tax=Georgenia daeguensis TaxID=908355 RepID=A0ABP6ULT7_9MICO
MSLDSRPHATSRPEHDPAPADPHAPDAAAPRPAVAAPETSRLSPEQEPEPEKDAPSDRPSGVQVTASALAAVTATGLLSTLGVAGTIIGAALSSVVTVLANYLYTSSLRRTAARVAAAPPVRKVRARTHAGTTATIALSDGPTDGSTVALEAATVVDGSVPAVAGGSTAAAAAAGGRADRLRAAWRAVVDRYGYRKIVITVVAFFAAVLAAVTLVELAAGKPLANVVRGEEGAGTSLFGNAPAAVEPETTDSGPGTVPEDGTRTETEDQVTDPATPPPGVEQPTGTDGEIAEEAPTTEPEPGSDAEEVTPPADDAPASEDPSPAPTESPTPAEQAPADGVPSPLQPEIATPAAPTE